MRPQGKTQREQEPAQEATTMTFNLPKGLTEVLDSIDVAIFDFDGTLAYTQGNNLSIYQQIFAEIGIDGITLEEYSSNIGNPIETHVRHIAKCHGLEMTDDDVDAMATRFIDVADAFNAEHIPRMYSYLPQALGHLAQARCLVVTANKCEHVDRVLRAWGIRNQFDGILTPQDKRPKRDTYEELLREPAEGLREDTPARMIVFEDSPNCLADAKELGMLTVGIVHPRSGRHSTDHADFRIDMRGECPSASGSS